MISAEIDTLSAVLRSVIVAKAVASLAAKKGRSGLFSPGEKVTPKSRTSWVSLAGKSAVSSGAV